MLSYSGLGFGGSGCKIELDDPPWDGRAAAQLIRFLGGGGRSKEGVRVNYVIHDRRAVNGRHYKHDPRVGMIGGSYGGQIQFAAAGATPRLDTIIPIITWNDLAYSLVPNNSALRTGVTSSVPGIPKFEWAPLFFSLGAGDGITGLDTDPNRVGTCPNFDPGVCPAFVKNAALGYPDVQTLNLLRHASVSSYMKKIRIPTLLPQGEHDTLFNLHEAAATYHALRRRHVPVGMIWQSWGHSSLGPAPGEFDLGPAADHLRGAAHRAVVQLLPEASGPQARPQLLLLPRLGALHGHRHAGLLLRQALPAAGPSEVLPLGICRPRRAPELGAIGLGELRDESGGCRDEL